MSVLKVLELMGNSNESFEKAVQNVIDEASRTVKNIKSVNIKNMQVSVEDNKIVQYRVTTKVTFNVTSS